MPHCKRLAPISLLAGRSMLFLGSPEYKASMVPTGRRIAMELLRLSFVDDKLSPLQDLTDTVLFLIFNEFWSSPPASVGKKSKMLGLLLSEVTTISSFSMMTVIGLNRVDKTTKSETIPLPTHRTGFHP